jgi:hypothetical protein
MIFFRPTKDFITWLKKYAGNRVVVDIGCGEGCLLHAMLEADIPCFGIDPYEPIVHDPDRDFETPEEIIMPEFGEHSEIIKRPEALLIIARPCHDGFPTRVIENKGKDVELLYIGKQENIELDLDEEIKYKQLLVPSAGDENEIVLSIR